MVRQSRFVEDVLSPLSQSLVSFGVVIDDSKEAYHAIYETLLKSLTHTPLTNGVLGKLQAVMFIIRAGNSTVYDLIADMLRSRIRQPLTADLGVARLVAASIFHEEHREMVKGFCDWEDEGLLMISPHQAPVMFWQGPWMDRRSILVPLGIWKQLVSP